MIISIALLSVTFSIDALGIGLSYGARRIRVPFLSQVVICLVSMFFMSAAIFFGDTLLCFVDAYVAKMLGVIILLLMGVFVVCKSFFQVDDYDFDQSEHIDFMEALYLGSAISIDAFAAGVGNSVSGCNNMWLPVCVALCQGLFLEMGLVLGYRCASRLHIKQSIFNFISGVLLIVLAILRFI